MPKRSWKQIHDPETGKYRLVEITVGQKEGQAAPNVRGDVESFVSPIDGTVISGRKAMMDHCKKHNVVPAQEFSAEHYAAKAKERENLYTGKRTRQEEWAAKAAINDLINRAERR